MSSSCSSNYEAFTSDLLDILAWDLGTTCLRRLNIIQCFGDFQYNSCSVTDFVDSDRFESHLEKVVIISRNLL